MKFIDKKNIKLDKVPTLLDKLGKYRKMLK